jgi:hypothetical protein
VETYFKGEYGRLRDVVEGPDGALYLATSNKDGRGRPNAGDDQLLKLTVRLETSPPAGAMHPPPDPRGAGGPPRRPQ